MCTFLNSHRLTKVSKEQRLSFPLREVSRKKSGLDMDTIDDELSQFVSAPTSASFILGINSCSHLHNYTLIMARVYHLSLRGD